MERKTMRRNPVYTDPLMLHPGVVSYRMRFRLTPSPGFRRDIAVTIDYEGLEGIRLWNDVLRYWKGNPQNIKGMLSRYEYLLETENIHDRRTA